MSASYTKQQYKAYASATQTVAKTQQIIMLYDGTIRLIQQAKEAIRENRIEDRYNLLVKASTIVGGLQACLDFENGQQIANILYSFYSSVENRLFTIHRTNSIEACDELIDELKQMRDAWVAVDEADAASSVPAAPAVSIEQNAQQPSPKPDAVNITLSA